jgi:large subunit ribosomal protein L22
VEDAQLFVKVVYVDGGAMLKRWLPAPHGRAFKKRKRSNHITIIVDSKVLMEQEKKLAEGVVEEPLPIEGPVAEPTVTEEAPVKKAKTKKKKEAAVAQ